MFPSLFLVIFPNPRGVARDFGFDHQRFRDPFEEGTPALPPEGAHSSPQAQVCPTLPPAAELLHRAVRRKRPRHGHARLEGEGIGGLL